MVTVTLGNDLIYASSVYRWSSAQTHYSAVRVGAKPIHDLAHKDPSMAAAKFKKCVMITGG
jgi:hypothetical protein